MAQQTTQIQQEENILEEVSLSEQEKIVITEDEHTDNIVIGTIPEGYTIVDQITDEQRKQFLENKEFNKKREAGTIGFIEMHQSHSKKENFVYTYVLHENVVVGIMGSKKDSYIKGLGHIMHFRYILKEHLDKKFITALFHHNVKNLLKLEGISRLVLSLKCKKDEWKLLNNYLAYGFQVINIRSNIDKSYTTILLKNSPKRILSHIEVIQKGKSLPELFDDYNIILTKLEELELIAKRAQSDYFRQKIEFDALVARREEEKKSEKIDAIVSLAQKIIPGLANLQVSLQHIPSDLMENKRVEGIQMTAEKQLKDIESLGIIIEKPEIGSEVDFAKHIPVGTESVENEDQKGKIIKILDNLYLYQKDGIEKVVLPAKVIVGN